MTPSTERGIPEFKVVTFYDETGKHWHEALTRLKGRGSRWDMPNAPASATLTTLRDSNQWNLFWPTPATTKT